MREITIQLTEKCNLSCKYCFADKKSSLEINSDDLAYFMQFCKKNNVESIHVTGGEPMLFSKFQDCIKKLSNLAYLVIYSNFTICDMIKDMNLRNRDIIFLVNINHHEDYTHSQWNNLIRNIESAKNQGIRLAFGHTFYRSTIKEDFEYIVGMNQKYNVKLLRLSQAISNDNISNYSLNMNQIRELYSLIANKYNYLQKFGIKCYFDCPLPACWIGESIHKKLIENCIIDTNCDPSIFVAHDLSLHHCYIEPKNLSTRSLRDFTDYEEAYTYLTKRIQSVLVQKPLECKKCFHSDFLLGCGCPIQSSYKYKNSIANEV